MSNEGVVSYLWDHVAPFGDFSHVVHLHDPFLQVVEDDLTSRLEMLGDCPPHLVLPHLREDRLPPRRHGQARIPPKKLPVGVIRTIASLTKFIEYDF